MSFYSSPVRHSDRPSPQTLRYDADRLHWQLTMLLNNRAIRFTKLDPDAEIDGVSYPNSKFRLSVPAARATVVVSPYYGIIGVPDGEHRVISHQHCHAQFDAAVDWLTRRILENATAWSGETEARHADPPPKERRGVRMRLREFPPTDPAERRLLAGAAQHFACALDVLWGGGPVLVVVTEGPEPQPHAGFDWAYTLLQADVIIHNGRIIKSRNLAYEGQLLSEVLATTFDAAHLRMALSSLLHCGGVRHTRILAGLGVESGPLRWYVQILPSSGITVKPPGGEPVCYGGDFTAAYHNLLRHDS